MTNRQNPFFFEIEPIPENSSLFDEFKNQKIFFSYFQVDQNYYLFFYAQEPIDINLLYQYVDVIQELDSKQRKIRSLRGFFLYVLEIMSNRKGLEILKTNLETSFWRNLQKILRQNKKEVLIEFLFGRPEESEALNPILEERLENLQKSNQELNFQVDSLRNQVARLEQLILNLESQLINLNYALSGPVATQIPLESSKTIQHDNSTMNVKKGPYLPENDPKPSTGSSEVRNTTYQTKDIESKSLSESPKSFSINSAESQEYTSEDNFVDDVWRSPGKISEDEKIEIIKLGFQLQAEGKISLKKYYFEEVL